MCQPWEQAERGGTRGWEGERTPVLRDDVDRIGRSGAENKKKTKTA